jgi:DNA repair protein RadC
VSEPGPRFKLEPPITDPEAVIRLLPELRRLPHEEVWLITVTARLLPINTYMVARGARSHAILDPCLIARHCILDAAQGAFLVHNHPSGDPTPSYQDRGTTQRIADALNLFDIQLYDHLVVAGETWCSAN